MALNFPNNPNINDTYSYNNKDYIWNGSVWLLVTTIADAYTPNFIDGGAPDSVYLPQDSLDGGAPDSVYE